MKPIAWQNNDGVLFALPLAASVFTQLDSLAAGLLQVPKRRLLIEYGPRRATACAELGLNPDHTILFVVKPAATRKAP